MPLRTISKRLLIDWAKNKNPYDETGYLQSASGDHNLVAPGDSVVGGSGQVSQMSLTLNNADGRFSGDNSASPLYAYLSDNAAYHAPVTFDVDVGAGWVRIFTGVIKIPQETAGAPKQGARVSLTCRGREEEVIQDKQSTPMGTFVALHGLTEAEIIKEWLKVAGLSEGIDYSDATIDPGRFAINYAWLDDESPINDCWDLAQAAGGWFYADRNGLFRYDNITNWLHRSTRYQIDRSKMGGMSKSFDDRDLASKVEIEYAMREPGKLTDLWKADEIISIAPGETRTITGAYSKPCSSVEGVRYDAVTAGGIDLSADLALAAFAYYAQRAEFTFTNTNTIYAIELRNLRVVGTPLTGGPTGSATFEENTGGWWASMPSRVRSGGYSSVYVQGPIHAAYIATVLGTRIQKPSQVFTVRNFPGDPTLDLGDIFDVFDSRSMDAAKPAHLIGLAWRFADMKYLQTLTLADSSDVYQYEVGPGADKYFVCDESAIGAGNHRLFY